MNDPKKNNGLEPRPPHSPAPLEHEPKEKKKAAPVWKGKAARKRSKFEEELLFLLVGLSFGQRGIWIFFSAAAGITVSVIVLVNHLARDDSTVKHSAAGLSAVEETGGPANSPGTLKAEERECRFAALAKARSQRAPEAQSASKIGCSDLCERWFWEAEGEGGRCTWGAEVVQERSAQGNAEAMENLPVQAPRPLAAPAVVPAPVAASAGAPPAPESAEPPVIAAGSSTGPGMGEVVTIEVGSRFALMDMGFGSFYCKSANPEIVGFASWEVRGSRVGTTNIVCNFGGAPVIRAVVNVVPKAGEPEIAPVAAGGPAGNSALVDPALQGRRFPASGPGIPESPQEQALPEATAAAAGVGLTLLVGQETSIPIANVEDCTVGNSRVLFLSFAPGSPVRLGGTRKGLTSVTCFDANRRPVYKATVTVISGG